MAANKTQPTGASVAAYLAGIEDDSRRKDCRALLKLMTRATSEKPKMWGPSIVGFGRYHYRYDSGREGDACATGFSSRRPDITVYLVAATAEQQSLLGRLGKHKMAKSCLYIRRLSDVDTAVLEQLVRVSVAEVHRRYGGDR